MSLRFKRHYKLVAMLVLLSTLLVAGAGDEPIVAYSLPSSGQAVEQVVEQAVGTSPNPGTVTEAVDVASQALILPAGWQVIDDGSQ